MKVKAILNILGTLLIVLSFTLLIPLLTAIIYKGQDLRAFLISIIITFATGLIFRLLTPSSEKITLKESFGLVTFSWISFAFFGALPLYIYGIMFDISSLSFTNSFFEIMSGFTTTGSTIISVTTDLPNAIESLPHGILMWRSLSQWIGGMGIVVLSLAILPLLGVGGMELYKAEIPGPSADKLTPRVKETAEILWAVYFGISAIEIMLLYFGGMNLFDSLCHTFSTMSTGGFSPKNASVAHYNSPFIEYIIIIFMFISGANFSLHFFLIKGKLTSYLKDTEFITYFSIIVLFTVVILFNIKGEISSLSTAFRHSLFQVVSICTTTGFGTADYEKWFFLSQFMLFVLMLIGGCGGSTGGGIKVIRLVLIFKQVFIEMRKLLHPKAVFSIKLNGSSVSNSTIQNIIGFFSLYAILFIIATAIMSALGLDFESALGSVAACFGNIGPGLGSVGPTDNYAHIPMFGKWVLSFCMLLGRLEIYTVLIIFLPEAWKR